VSDFAVSLDDLGSLVSELSGLAGELDQAGHITPDCASAGSPRVESSMQSFFRNWSEGMDMIKHNLSLLTNALAGARDGYQKTDSAIAGEFRTG
jgi:hypothetical protein